MEGGLLFFLFSLSDDCLHGWLLSWLFIILAVVAQRPCAFFFLPFWNRRPIPRSPMSYPQGYLYQPPGSLALYSCPAYGASALAAPRNEDLARSSSGSAFSPYPGSAAFSASAGAGFSSPLSYSTDPTTGFPSYMVKIIIIIMITISYIHVWSCAARGSEAGECGGVLKSVTVPLVFLKNPSRFVMCCSNPLISKCSRNFFLAECCWRAVSTGLHVGFSL